MYTLEDRLLLKQLLLEGYQVKEITNMTRISRATIYNELKRGLTSSEYVNRRYIKYEPARAIEHDIKNRFGEEELNYYLQWIKGDVEDGN